MTKDRTGAVGHSEGQERASRTPSYQEMTFQQQKCSPQAGRLRRNGMDLGTTEVPQATHPAAGALRRLQACLGFRPPRASAGIARCSWLAGPSILLGRSVWLSVRQDIPANTSVVAGCGGQGYLVFWRSSRSQVGSVWPILYSSLESSMLWSR